MKRIDRILLVAIIAPIVLALLIGGGSMIWTGLVTILKSIVPNPWVIIAYIYIALVAFLIGRKTKK